LIKHENTGTLAVYYGNTALIDTKELRRLFTYFNSTKDTLLILKYGNNFGKVSVLDDTAPDAKKLDCYKLFDIEDPKVFASISDKKLQTPYNQSTSSYNGVQYKISDVIPAGMPQKMVDKLFSTIVTILESKAAKPIKKDVDVVMFFDNTKNVDTKKLISRFSAFKTSGLTTTKSVFEVTLLDVEINSPAYQDIDKIYKEINPTAGYIKQC
jgi:hypothetical protein